MSCTAHPMTGKLSRGRGSPQSRDRHFPRGARTEALSCRRHASEARSPEAYGEERRLLETIEALC